MDIYEVAIGNLCEDDHNTIVLGGIDLVVPLEMDVDGDPLQDDEVRLRRVDGLWEDVLTVSHPDVVPEQNTRLLLYRFREVPPGLYDVSVCVAGNWKTLVRGIFVGKGGAFVGKAKLDEDLPSTGAATAEKSDDAEQVFDADDDRIDDLD